MNAFGARLLDGSYLGRLAPSVRDAIAWVGGDERLATRAAHRAVLEMVDRLGAFLPESLRRCDLVEIVRPKAADYYTGLDDVVRDYWLMKQALERTGTGSAIAGLLAHRSVRLLRGRLARRAAGKRGELALDGRPGGTAVRLPVVADRRILFFGSLQTYLRVLVLYLEQSRVDAHLLVVPRWLGGAEILRRLPQDRLLFLDDFVTPAIWQQHLEAKETLTELFDSRRDLFDEAFVVDGRSFFSIVERGVERVVKDFLPEALLLYLAVEELHRQAPAAAMVGVRVRRAFDRAFFAYARQRNIPRYVLLHSNINAGPRTLAKMGHFPGVDGVFAWGELQKHRIREDPHSHVRRIHVTGSPLFPSLASRRSATSHPSRDFTILYAGTTDDLTEVRELTRSAKAWQPGCRLIVKAHPGATNPGYEAYCTDPWVRTVLGNAVLEDFLHEADLLVTTVSESSLQSMVRGVPTLYFSLRDKWKAYLAQIYDFDAEEEQQLVMKTPSQLSARVTELRQFKSARQALLTTQERFLTKRIKLHASDDGASREVDRILTQVLRSG